MRPVFQPVDAQSEGKRIILTLSDGGEIALDMPSPDSAQFNATAMRNDFARAKRDGF